MSPEPVPPLTQLKTALRAFPETFLGFLIGLVVAILTTTEAYMIVLLALFVSLATNAWIGVAVAWGAYTLFYMIGQYGLLWSTKVDAFLRIMGSLSSWNNQSK